MGQKVIYSFLCGMSIKPFLSYSIHRKGSRKKVFKAMDV